MNRTLDRFDGVNGGAVQLAKDPGRARNIHVTLANGSNITHAIFFGRSRRELAEQPIVGGNSGFAVVVVPNTVANQTVNGVAYQNIILQGWVGELWACADPVGGLLQVDVIDGGSPES